MIYTYVMNTKQAKLHIYQEEDDIIGLYFGENPRLAGAKAEKTELLTRAETELMEYLAGERREFDLPQKPSGTPFQLSVWSALCDIPYGETRSYGEIASAIDNPKASRAVGLANNRNPISIIVPCHRVIGSSGKLIGYGGGLDVKRWLLELEAGSRA